MTGLLQQGVRQPQGAQQPPPQAQQGQAQPRPGQPSSGRDPRVDMDPKQGAQQYQQLVGAMLENLYGPMIDGVRQMLEQSRSEPEQAIARIVSHLMVTTWQLLADQGKTVPPGVMFQAGMEISKAVGEIAIRMGILPEQGNGEPIEAAFMMAMAQFGKVTAESMPPAQRKRFGEMVRGLREAKSMSQQRPAQGQPQQSQGSNSQMQGGV